MTTDFTKIKFNQRWHTYSYEGKRLTNVTKLAGSFGEPFDADGISARKAKELGVSQEEILAEWDARRQLGTNVHATIAQILRGEEPHKDPVLALSHTPHVSAFLEFWEVYGQNANVLEVEWIIGDHELGIAGTVDAVISHGGSNGKAVLFDWKTNSQLTTHGYGRTLKPPFEDRDDSKLMEYTLQLSAYKLILRRNTNLALGDCYLLHLTDAGFFQPYRLEDLSAELEQWLRERKELGQ